MLDYIPLSMDTDKVMSVSQSCQNKHDRKWNICAT